MAQESDKPETSEEQAGHERPSAIGDYALIGDCETAALVSRNGSIDWLCWPRFDSDACFAALVGDCSNGCWRLAPSEPFTTQRRYRPGTLILETVFKTGAGEVMLIDFMPPRGEASDVVRLVRGLRGRVAMRMELVLRFGYGATAPWVSQIDTGLRAIAGPDMTLLRTPVRTHGEGLTTVAQFTVSEGETVPFTLTYQPSHQPPAPPLDPTGALAATERFWTEWLERRSRLEAYDEVVERSLITLKALTHRPTGGVVAAPTTSLPEEFGGERNWDYRYCWIRDATFTLLALMNAGFYEEAGAWRDWLLRAVAGEPADLQIMYGVGGERRLTEWTADWLPGHAGSKPVRIGNAAHQQFQLDVYGELLDSFYQARRGGLPSDEATWDLEKALVKHVAQVWREPDAGMWEVRGELRRFTFSRVMAWVAVDRAIKVAEGFGEEAPLDEWRDLRETIKADIWDNGFDRERNTFVRAYDDRGLDASLLLLGQVGFIAADDPAYVGTVEAVERELLVEGFLLRYRTETAADGLPPGEGVFLACSFWLADAYAAIGRRDEAKALFERLLTLRNDLGLLAEEYDPAGQRQAGNFPQAFSHIGLINTAANLTHPVKPSAQRADGHAVDGER